MKQTAQTYHVKTPLGKFHCAIYNQVSEQKSDAVSSPCVETGKMHPLGFNAGRLKVNMSRRCSFQVSVHVNGKTNETPTNKYFQGPNEVSVFTDDHKQRAKCKAGVFLRENNRRGRQRIGSL